MNLYLLEAPTHGYDVYTDAVVAADTEDDAKRIHPGSDGDPRFPWYVEWPDERQEPGKWSIAASSWVRTADEVTATLIGTAKEGTKRGVICASFHAG